MKIEFRRSFARDLKRIREATLYNRIEQIIAQIEAADTLIEIINTKKLKGEDDYYRIRVGSYRVGLKLEDDTVIFIRFLHRRDIYRYFP